MGICSGLNIYISLPNDKLSTIGLKNVIIGNNSIFISYRSSIQPSSVRYPPTAPKTAVAASAAMTCFFNVFFIPYSFLLCPRTRIRQDFNKRY